MDKPGLRDALPQPKLSDTRTDPFWSNLDSSLSAAAAPSAAQTPQRDLDVGLGDVARGVGAGALELVGGIGELARQASQFGKENAGKQGGDYLEQARANMASKLSPVLDVVAGAGDLAKSGAESLTEGMSGDAKEAIGRSLIDETPEGRLTMGDGAGDLDVWAMKMAQGVGSMVPTLLAGGVTGAAAKASIGRAVTTSMLKRGATQEVAEAVAAKTVAKLATGAAVTTGATGSVGSAGVNTRESVLGMSFDELSRSDTFRQAFTRIDQDQQTQHLSDEEKLSLAREETANVASRATMSDAKVWGAAAMGSVMGDAMLFKMLAGKAATGGVLKGAAKGAVGEGIGETLEEGVQQYTINESLNEVAAADIDPMKGVVSSALEGGLIGMGTGGALGGAGGLRGSKSQPESEGGSQVDLATVEDVAPVEQGEPMQENPAAAPADPDLAPATDAMADPVVAPSGEQSPLGPSASQFDELRDVPAYLRRDDTAERFKGMAENSPVQEALSGTPAPTVDDLLSQVASQQVDTIEVPAISSQQQAAEENAAEQLTTATDTAEGIVADDAAQAQPLEQNPAPPALDAVVGQLQTLRITRKGKPFATEKEAAMASRKGKEMPVPLNGGGFGVAEIAEVEQVKAAATTQPSAPQLDDISVTDPNQPSDQPAASVSAETVPAPSATAGEASQLAPAIDTGYREVIPVNQPQTEVRNEPVTPVPAISSEGQGDQPGAGEPAAAGAGPAIAGLADRAGSGNPADNTPASPVPDGQQQDDPTLTAPAPDAGAAVSEVAQPDPVVPAPVAAPTPWAEAIDNPDGTITLKGEVPLIKQWAKDSGVKAMPGKGGLLVAKSSAAKVREYATPAASEPVQQIEAARAEVAPEPTDAQKEAGNYKKGHLKLQGLDIALENPKGSTRSGTDKDGKAWQSTMAHDYGYIKRTLGADWDHVDVFIGDRPDSETVYVVDQVDPKTGKFDEHKVMMGFADEQAAQTGYLANYEKGWKGLGSIKAMPVEEFKRWVKEGDTTKPVADAVPAKGPEQSKAQKAEAVKEPERAITFSKQAMAQGEKPAKHLTRKEAELVTKEWFKQYRGASGINVQIHATQAELEQALGLAAKEGLIRRAAFDDDNGTLHVAADTIANPKRMREILRHEVLAHYGLANVLGDGEYTKLISRLIKSRNDPSMKAVWDWVDTHYADEELGVQAEEVVAHLAELEQSAWRRGWDQVVAWVTKALRTVGFVPGGITAAETRVLIEGLGKKMKRGGPDNGGPDGGHKFSQEDGRTSQYKNPLGTTQGLQLPKRGSPERVSDSNVLTKNDIRKGGLKMSQSNTAADDSKTLEQSIKQKAVYQAGAALSSVKNWLKQGRPLMLGTLTDLQIDQVYRDITGGAVSQYQRLRTQMEADRNDILLDAETRIDPLWDALGKQEKADLSNLMHDATMTRLHPDKSLDENSYYQEAKQKLERAKKPETRAAYEAELRTIELNHSALAKQYNALPANAKELYGTMLDTYTKQWESLRGAIEQRLEDLLGVSEGRAMAAEMRQKMEHALQHGPYFPLTRYGDYVVKARKGDEYVREHFERRADAEQAVKQYQRDGYNAVMTVKEEGGGDSANANQLGMEMLSFLDSADGVSKTALKDEIWQAMLRMMPDASYAKHAIHRRRVKGASRDAHRAYLNSVYHYARHVSKIRYGHKMQGELDKLSEQIRAGVAGEPSSLKPDDLEIAQQVLNEMNKRHDLNMNPTGKAWAGAAGNIGFLYYIGPSLASAVVNMTQNFTVMLPQLGAKYGFAKSASAMTEALRDYWRHGKFKAGTTEAWRSLTRSTTLPADERAMLERLYRSGVLDLTQAHSIAAKADTDQQDAKPMSKGWRRAMRWAGATFHNAEVLNREVAALAAYRLLKQAEPTLDGQQYADRVAEMVYDGHGNYAASNRPRYMRNDITKVLTQFKIYSQMMTYVLYSNAIKAAKGDRIAAKTLAGVLATHWVMAGVMGLPTPIAAVAYALAAAFDDDDDRSGEASFRLALTEALGPRAGELLAKGPMDAITNLSIAGRTGLGDLWWRSPKEGTEGDDLAWHAVQQLLGPVAGIGINMARGAGQMTDGHIQRGMETVLPKSIRDAAKALRQATEGEQTIKGDVIMDDVSAWNVAMQAIGFGSAQMAKNYDAREYIKGKERRIADKRSELMADYYNARKSGDMDAVQEVLDHIKMFNATHNPGERITGKSLALSFKSKLRSNERTQGGVYLNRNREYLREEGKFAEQ
ncbi:PLxRFG domain-containing protein [Aeromonas veronii]|uniref:PLxRFG domain-containing protein n=1 Tax=Aeromonas veronii TaxID=654 RepID=UPI0035B6E013